MLVYFDIWVRFPIPVVPQLSPVSDLVSDILVIALIAFSISYSLSSVYARQEGYEVDANQVIPFNLYHCG